MHTIMAEMFVDYLLFDTVECSSYPNFLFGGMIPQIRLSHFVFSQGKFVFAIFACDHEFLASDDASSLRELRLLRTLALTRVQTENVKM